MARMGRTREVGLLVLAALGCLAAAPALAAATKWCVGEPTCLAEGGVKEQPNGTGLQEALEAATKGTSPREIVIGPGTYSAGKEGFSYSGSQVIIRGAGAGATVLTRAPES